jgi:NAD(P)-dependent dehydrogenase (short-subunit alcohol dehydrogenase family)
VVEEIRQDGGSAEGCVASVACVEGARQIIQTAIDRFGRIDVLVNNAGIYFVLPLSQVPEEEWDRLMSVNLKGVYLGCKYAIPQMVGQGGGAIVNVASIAGLRGFANWTTYCASKGGVIQLTKAVAMELARLNVRVNCVCPGIIDTGMFDQAVDMVAADRDELAATIGEVHPMGRIGRPEEVAAAILFLASEEASFITGVPLSVDGGLWAGSAPQEGLV